jgi:lipopolysaccharide/colanic/teichoic acid biosynthesis glycosyltransferase
MSAWLRLRVRLDRAVAAVLLVPAAPVLAAIALLVRRDGGPPFITVRRRGRGGADLGMWKVRTMRASGPGGLAGGAALTAGDDDRITPVGRRIRRFRLDELPQLLNVVRGDMALLGPRPEAPEYVDLDDARWQAILEAPPGIAGVTQVLVNHWEAEILRRDTGDAPYVDVVLPVKVAVDAWYVRHASPWIDVLALAALAGSVAGRATPRLRRRVERDVPELAALPRG